MRGAVLALLLALGGLSAPAAAQAARRTYTLRSGPVPMAAFNVAFPKVAVRAPHVDGYVVRMSAALVDARGRTVTIRDVMLHHVVFFRLHRRVPASVCAGATQETFYGTGEEREQLRLPPGYGYRITRRDRWRMNAMLMSHSLRALDVYVRYRVTVATHVRLAPVRPFWVRANGCGSQVSYPVFGGGAAGSSDTRTYRWRVPMNGRIVAVGGHLHGGARDMWLSQAACRGRRLLDTSPRFGMPDSLYYRARPILHEPGPVDTRYFLSRTGIAVRRGEVLTLTGAYDGEHPHSRVMAIMHVYVAPGPAPRRRCAPLPADRRELVKHRRVRTRSPVVTVPLNELDARGRTREILTPPWPVARLAPGAAVALRGLRFTRPHIALPAGARLTWRFDDAVPHNVTFANGPRLVGSPTLGRGASYTTRFRVPGRYELFCYLHPMQMHEVVDVT